jgi:hypothetical protein
VSKLEDLALFSNPNYFCILTGYRGEPENLGVKSIDSAVCFLCIKLFWLSSGLEYESRDLLGFVGLGGFKLA